MNDFNKLLGGLQSNNLPASQINSNSAVSTQPETNKQPEPINTIPRLDSPLFEADAFRNLVKVDSHSKNKSYATRDPSISGYSLAHDCIRQVLFKMLKTQLSDYSSNWLPLGFRSALGTATHDYIQRICDGKIFTECEITLKVPSKMLSMRLDATISSVSGDDTLVEIKSVPYSDFGRMVKSRKPRPGDWMQAVLYRYLLHHHLEEMKQQKPTHGGKRPDMTSYNIRYIQMIYVAHELVCSDDAGTMPMSEAVKYAASLRRLVKNQSSAPDFPFILPLTIDCFQMDVTPVEEWLMRKTDTILEYFKNKEVPSFDNEFTDTGKCFFCPYKTVCQPPR